jgi:hypothetical protein
MSCTRALYVQNIFNRGPLEPRKFFVIEEILVPAYEYPDTEW